MDDLRASSGSDGVGTFFPPYKRDRDSSASLLRPRLRTVSTGEIASFRGLISDAVTVLLHRPGLRTSSSVGLPSSPTSSSRVLGRFSLSSSVRERNPHMLAADL
ncbi:hypothetical protein OPV22_024376 [Ensete ventricosum]|uniref:Uncharacterized protein n=1 Tax=Ensete ventricosum TaxID=4639 RepID=A0AAV8QGU8_ENSVE|nr:hypothetical protein OPV22_024376 [Ensete ventricosum]